MVLLTGVFKTMKSFSLPWLSFLQGLESTTYNSVAFVGILRKRNYSSLVEDTNNERKYRFHS